MAELEIIGVPQSNFVWAVRMAAVEKGVPCRIHPAFAHTPEVEAIHPLGKIPVMRHGDLTLFESRAICTYIDRAFPGPQLVPADPVLAAQTEQWISCVSTSVDQVFVRQYLLGYVFPGTPDGSPNRAKIEAALPPMEAQLARIAKALETGYLAAGRFTLADIYLLPILFYLTKFPESSAMLAKHPAAQRYLAAHMARESFKNTIPPPMPKRT